MPQGWIGKAAPCEAAAPCSATTRATAPPARTASLACRVTLATGVMEPVPSAERATSRPRGPQVGHKWTPSAEQGTCIRGSTGRGFVSPTWHHPWPKPSPLADPS